jgi:putative ABC transport system permease protein
MFAAYPSPLAESVLNVIVRDHEQREAILGDLREEHARLAARVGAAKAARWHLRQSLGIAVRYSVGRMLRRKPPVRWFEIATAEPDGPWWTGLTRDVLYARRAIMQRPMVSFTVVLTLALALAANSTTFSLMDALVLRPYRFAGVDRLVVATTATSEESLTDRLNVSGADFREWRERTTTVENWAMYQWWDANLSGVDVPEQVPAFFVSAGFFELLSARPVLGREFLQSETEPGRHQRVVLSNGLWARRFASDPDIIGKSVRLDGEPFEVVGVAPAGFNIPDGAELWAPIAMTDAQWANRRAENYGIFGRLREGATLEQTRAELKTIVDTQRREFPDTNSQRYGRVLSFTAGMSDPGAGAFIGVWQAAAFLLLLIACANIANLLMARGAERSSEYALRLALGASRARIFTQTLLEGLLLALIAIVVSMPLLAIGLGVSRASIPASVRRFVPGWNYIEINLDLFVVTAVLGSVAMIVFSVLPAFQAIRAQVSDTLRQSGRSLTPGRNRQWLRSALATSQVAIALALLFGSAMSMTAADKTINGMLGFNKENVLVAQLNLPERNYSEADTRRRLITEVSDAMRVIPAVSSIGAVNLIPGAFNDNNRRFFPEGIELKEQDARWTRYRTATNDYFAALQIPLLRGRLFEDSDRENAPQVAVVSSALATAYWGDEDPLGKRFKLAVDGPWITVVGVSGNVVHNWFVRRNEMVYRPISQTAPYSVAFAVRTIGDPTALAGDLRRAVAKADADQPIASLATLDTLIEERAAGFVFIARALGVVGLIALVLSVMGIYSLMAFLTAQRTQEIGVRMALGAGRWQVIRATTRRALVITATGAMVGSALALGVGRLMENLLFGLVNIDLLQLAGLVSGLAAVALIAAYVPARRAAKIDPMTALRES